MSERDQILLILVVTCFFGSSFWPVVMGWVDVSTLDGWLQLVSYFGMCGFVVLVFAVIGSFGFLFACASRFGYRALVGPRSRERELLISGVVRSGRATYRLVDSVWKLSWRLTMPVRRRRAQI